MIKEVTKNDSAVRLYNWDNMPQDIDLYKIIPYKYLVQWIYNNSMCFKPVYKWNDDVYELFLFKQNYTRNGEPVDLEDVKKNFYGQSWSILKDSFEMWHVYSPDKLSVKVKTNLKKIRNVIENSNPISQGIGTFIGKVNYFETEQITDILLKNYAQNIFDEKNILDSLFVKRMDFKSEEEIRIILWKESNPRKIKSDPLIYLNVAPKDFITEVTFDPRLDDEILASLKSTLQILMPKVKIQKSKLNTIDPIDIKI